MTLGEVLRKWRIMSELDLRTAAKIMGLNSPATLLRIEMGHNPSARSLATIFTWLTKEAGTK